MTDQELKQYCGAVTVPDREIMDAARRRQAELAKPPGSLGKLEDYSIRLAGITGAPPYREVPGAGAGGG